MASDFKAIWLIAVLHKRQGTGKIKIKLQEKQKLNTQLPKL